MVNQNQHHRHWPITVHCWTQNLLQCAPFWPIFGFLSPFSASSQSVISSLPLAKGHPITTYICRVVISTQELVFPIGCSTDMTSPLLLQLTYPTSYVSDLGSLSDYLNANFIFQCVIPFLTCYIFSRDVDTQRTASPPIK